MITAMVAGYYEPNGNEVYPPGSDAYGDYCYGIQDMCSHMPCSFHGPGVRMVQNNSTGPLPVQLQVPPGHVVHQVVDENGTVRHYLLSPPMPLPVGGHYSPSHASSTGMAGTQYYPYPNFGPPYFQPPSHLQPAALSPQSIPGVLQTPPSQCNGESPLELDTSPPPSQVFLTQKDESYQRSTYKFRRKTDSRSRDKLTILPSQSLLGNNKDKKLHRYEDHYRISGSSASGSNASEDGEVTWLFTEYLSNLRPPMVTELSPYSVMVCWKPPDLPSGELEPSLCSTLQESEIMYEVMLCEKGKEGRYKSVYSGLDHHCNITSLKPATEYYICVQASVDDIRGSSVKGLTFKTPSVEPEAPQSPRLYARTKNSLTLKWNSSGDSSSSKVTYILECDEISQEGFSRNGFTTVYTGPLKQFKVTKLTPATGYRFRLAAMNDKGKSAFSETCCYFTSGNAPSQPSPPILKQAYINRLHLEWERRTFDDDFNLQIEDEMRHGFFTTYSGRETHFTCSGLRGNTEYKFRLCASNEEGSSPWSKIVTYCTLPDKLGCPGKPVPKGRIHASCFRLTWDPPKDCKHSTVTKYILEVDRGFGFDAVYTGPDPEFFLENLLPGTTYKVRVACITSAGHSPYSDVNSITTAAVSPGKCAQPKLQSKPEASFVCLDWAHPEHDGGAAVSEYEVDMTSPDNITLQVYKGPETSCIVNGLFPGRPYLFQVRAYNRVGAGPFSDPLEVVSGAGPPDSPRNLTATCDSSVTCRLSWEEPLNNGAAITSYQLQWSTEDDEESFSELYDGLCLHYEVQRLLPATSYYFKVRAINEAGPGPNSDTIMYRTPASLPGVISSVNVKTLSNSIYLSWTEPPTNGSEIISYNVELDDVLYNTEENIPELCIEDLSPETVYSLRIQAVNEVGVGPFSDPISVETMKSPPSPPHLECVTVSHNFLRLKWGDRREEEDSLYYTVEMSNRSKSFVPVYHGTSLGCKVNRLQENTSLLFRICASNESGQGPYSSVFTFRTTRAPPPLLKAPKIISVTEDNCQVEWTGVKISQGVLHYQLQLSSASSSDSIMVYQGSDTKCFVSNLEPNTQYTLRIAAVRPCEDGDLIGNLSPPTPFTTSSIDTAPHTSMALPQTISQSERRTMNDRHLSMALVFAFVLSSFLFAMLLEHIFCFTTQT
ncbi:fibronectin type-III domain-containing protein 3A isoform X2 [Parasteatoda tepidariorum]|uniref:fibronectin type-III domain-containing protein 3A isoform X2 n=1 Tax=Parasteatoda tepidariorum TaxID=114398 RepID=UPI001C7262A1|nr:fibronectin type-III domain-containing protein 3A isoform X2 [Parasteatoda tepidariorum]